ncbi:coiled-coil domain-containing protein 137 [Anabrus simplex]|uniref:coiled-coil domain-containing protein 137 n=1 Tax=Anabrus simplex TaxID=316456 RepID=UPI0034DD9943
MGRKIPGKKHRGIKDPYEQQAKRNESLSKKINAPPSSPDDQDIPKSVKHIMRLMQDVKDKKFVRKRKKKNKNKLKLINTAVMAEKELKLPGMTRPDKPAPEFVQRPGESNYFFMHRIERTCQEVLKESQFEEKFNVAVQRNPETGEVVSVTKAPKNKIEDLVGSSKKKNKNKGKPEKLTKKERRKIKMMEKRAKMKDKEVDEFDRFKDEVKFGEIVHQPPSLKTPLKLKTRVTTPEGRPGKKDLLLKQLLPSEQKLQHNTKVFKAAKKKNLSEGEQRQLEAERLKAVNMYRMLKTKKLGGVER